MEGEAMREVLDAARASVGVHQFGPEHGAAVLPDGFSIKDLRGLLPPPPRPVERVQMLTAESFCDYVKRYGNVERTVVFADEATGTYTGVLDYHAEDGARGTCDHVVVYSCQPSDEWKAWTGSDGKMMPQVDFARFLENNLPDIIAPPAADMLRIALTLQVKKDVKFESDLRLDNGQTQFRYEETVRGTTKGGDLLIPDSFALQIPVFMGGGQYRLDARLRYRVVEQKLTIGYELVRSAHVRSQVVRAVTEWIGQALTWQLYIGRR